MGIYSIPFALGNWSRSIVSLEWKYLDRGRLYFQNRRYLYEDYNTAIDILKDLHKGEVGLYIGGEWEYPLWAFAQEKGASVTFKHIGVRNVTGRLKEEIILPEFVIAAIPIDSWEHSVEYYGIYDSEHASVLRRVESERPFLRESTLP